MKPELTEVLIGSDGKVKSKYPGFVPGQPPPEGGVSPTVSFRNRTLPRSCPLLFACLLLLFLGLGLGVGLLSHYETKFGNYETRITALETDLAHFLRQLEQVEAERLSNDRGGVMTQAFVVPIRLTQPNGHQDTEDDEESYEEEDDMGVPLLVSDESDEGIDLEEEDDEKEMEEIVFGRVNAASRTKRQVTPANLGTGTERTARDTVAIVEGAYSPGGVGAVTPTESEGLRLYESLITTGGHGEPKAPEFAESEGSNVQAYHRTSAAWVDSEEDPTTISGRPRRLQVKSGDMTQGSTRIGDNPFYIRTTSPYSQHYAGSIASRRSVHGHDSTEQQIQNPNMIVRNSRVPATGDRVSVHPRNQHRSNYPYPPLRKIGQGDGQVIARVHQERQDSEEEADPDEAVAGADHGESSAFAVSRTFPGTGGQSKPSERDSTRRQRPFRKGHLLHPDAEELNIVQAEAWAGGPKTIAAHYVADSSNYSLSHRHYEGNGRLRNADGVFSSWKPSHWMTAGTDSVSKDLPLSPTGVVTIKKEGLYWIYAQVHYLDSHDINGFVIQVNSDPFLTCTRMTETAPGTTPKSNSCFTAGINYFKENDRILIRDIETNRYSIIRPEKSFFGLMRIGDVHRR